MRRKDIRKPIESPTQSSADWHSELSNFFQSTTISWTYCCGSWRISLNDVGLITLLSIRRFQMATLASASDHNCHQLCTQTVTYSRRQLLVPITISKCIAAPTAIWHHVLALLFACSGIRNSLFCGCVACYVTTLCVSLYILSLHA